LIDHTTSVIADGGSLMRLSSTGIDTGGATNGALLDVISTAQVAGSVAKITTGITTGKSLDIVSTSVTTGSALSVTSVADKDAINVVAGDVTMAAASDISNLRLYVGGTLTVANHGTGTGITDTLNTQALFDISTIHMVGVYLTTIVIDMTGLDHSGTGDGKVIGDGTDANCQLLTLADATHGQIYRIEMECIETPVATTAANADIDLLMGDDSTSGSTITNSAALLTAGAQWAAASNGAVVTTPAATAGYTISFNTAATNGKLVSLAGGAAGDSNAYTAGKLIIKLWGVPVAFIA
jgi:hypothetical protein